jgi:hypothetical protein
LFATPIVAGCPLELVGGHVAAVPPLPPLPQALIASAVIEAAAAAARSPSRPDMNRSFREPAGVWPCPVACRFMVASVRLILLNE